MAQIVTRQRKDGARYMVYAYQANNTKKHLGTFTDWDEANRTRVQYEEEELLRKTGRSSIEPAHTSVMTLRQYVYDESTNGYRKNSTITARTWQGYESILRVHILPVIGHKKVKDIKRSDVVEMLSLMEDRGAGRPTILRARRVLSTVMSTLLQAEVIDSNPCVGVKTKKFTPHEKPIFKKGDVAKLIAAMPTEGAKLFTRFLIDTGTRLGEAMEIRPQDINWDNGVVTISRAVTEVYDCFNDDGTGRFMVKTPKSGRSRRVAVSAALKEQLQRFVDEHEMAPDELLFSHANVIPTGCKVVVRNEPELTPDFIATLGLTEPNDRGACYQHGTITAYTRGRCRCEYCKLASRVYARKRLTKKHSRKPRTRTNLTGHMSRDAWYKVWYKACEDAGIKYHISPHSTRHTYATLILKSGKKDLHELQQLMGHAAITTTAIYLHRLEEDDNSSASIIEEML